MSRYILNTFNLANLVRCAHVHAAFVASAISWSPGLSVLRWRFFAPTQCAPRKEAFLARPIDLMGHCATAYGPQLEKQR
jgi:hypothetical protein